MSKPEKIARTGVDDAYLPQTDLLEAAKVSGYFTEIIEMAHPSVKDYRELISNLFEPSTKSEKYLRSLARFERDNIDLWDSQSFMDDFRIDAIKEKQIWLAKNPSLSQIGGGTPSNMLTRKIVPRETCVDGIFYLRAKVGGSAAIYGEMGSGKTDLAVAEIYYPMLESDWWITTNISIKDMPEKAKFSTKLSTTLLHALEHSIDCLDNNKPDMTAAILDEQQFSMPKERGTSNKNLFMKQMVLLSRKLKIWYCGIYQQKTPPTIIDEFARHWIEKPNLDRKDVANLDIKPIGKFRYTHTISGIKPAIDYGLEFDTDSVYVYTPDINPLRMFDFHDSLTEKPMTIREQKLALIDYVKSHQGEKLDIVSDDVKTKVLWDIRNRFKGSQDKIERKVATFQFLARMVGWNTTTLQARFGKLEQSIRDGLIIPEDPEDAMRELAGSIGVSDGEEYNGDKT